MKKVFAIVLAVMILCSMMLVPVSASNDGEIGTSKAEYLEGEMVEMWYEFPAGNKDRFIWVYKTTDLENAVKIISATGTSGTGLSPLWYPSYLENGKPLSAGDYVMKVTNSKGVPYTPEVTATFKINSNPSLTRNPSISLDKTTYGLTDTMVVSYDGVTDALPYNKTLQVTIYDSEDFPASSEPIYLWNTREFIGISGELEIDLSDFDLWTGDFYAVLEFSDEYMDMSHTRIDFQIVDTNSTSTTAPGASQIPDAGNDATVPPASTNEPVGDETNAPADGEVGSQPSVEPTQAPEEKSGGNTLLYVVIGIAAVLGIALVVVVVLLVKKKK